MQTKTREFAVCPCGMTRIDVRYETTGYLDTGQTFLRWSPTCPAAVDGIHKPVPDPTRREREVRP